MLGWKRLLRRTRQNIGPRLVAWRGEVREGARSEDEWLLAFDEGVKVAESLFVLALTAIESEIPSICDQTALIDDLVHIEGWHPSGPRTVAHMPGALGFLYHHIVGAMLLESSHHSDATRLLTRHVRSPDGTETHPIWRDGELMGWVESLRGNCITSWQYVRSLWASRKWMATFFRSERSFFDSYRAYATIASAIELATLLGKDTAPEEVNEDRSLNVPPMFINAGDEKGTDITEIVRRAIPSVEVLSEIAKTGGCDVTAFRTAWPLWFHQWCRFISQTHPTLGHWLGRGHPPRLPE